jgi:GT2 family glycosyltransferase
VTIIAVTRERFSFVPEFIETLYANTNIPFKLVYVDGGSPKKIKKHLESEAFMRDFTLLRTDHYLSPVSARNLGTAYAQTPYVVFIDNDVAVSSNWLNALLSCAEETGADGVGALIAETWQPETLIHYGGGEACIEVRKENGRETRALYKKVFNNGRVAATASDELVRKRCSLIEFHCVLIRRSIFQKIGSLDEALSSEDHTDFSIRVNECGGTLYFEPASRVTYVSSPVTVSDIPFYLMRWSDTWQGMSYTRMIKKWNITEDDFFKIRRNRMDTFRNKFVFRPWSKRLFGGLFEGLLMRTFAGIARAVDLLFYKRYFEQKASPPLQYRCLNLKKEREPNNVLQEL